MSDLSTDLLLERCGLEMDLRFVRTASRAAGTARERDEWRRVGDAITARLEEIAQQLGPPDFSRLFCRQRP